MSDQPADPAKAVPVQLERHGTLIYAAYDGTPSFDEALTYTRVVAKEVRATGVRGVLSDLSALEQVIPVVDRLGLSAEISRFWPSEVKLAVLIAPEFYTLDHIFEHAAGRRGMQVRIFTNRDEAIEWLLRDAK